MKVTLTDNQARAIIQACDWAINPDYPKSDSTNACYIRIIEKLERGLGEAERDWGRFGRMSEAEEFREMQKVIEQRSEEELIEKGAY